MPRCKNGKDGTSFVLHDGPPFTNGDVHVGTALNKILKDSILRYKNAQGFRTPYIPGWDCHGIPIEHKVTKKLRASKVDFDSVNSVKNARNFPNLTLRPSVPSSKDSAYLQIGIRNIAP